jgi:alpha-galactosidase
VSRAKIVVIGVGSTVFGLGTLAGIMRTKGLKGAEIALVDIDADKVANAERLANRLNREWDSDITVHASRQRREVLHGADFVVICVAVDREDSWKQDHELALRYGIAHYAENGGPGAVGHTLRNLALIMPILTDIKALAPDATVINFSNPLTRISHAIANFVGLKSVGMCHAIGIGYALVGTAMHRELGMALREDPRWLWDDESSRAMSTFEIAAKKRYRITAGGINHFSWILDIRDRANGEDVYPAVKARMADLPSSFEPLTQRMFASYGLIPFPGDTHISEYVSFASTPETWDRYDIQLYDFDRAKRERDVGIAHMAELADGRAPLEPLLAASSERAEFIIDAIVNDRGSVEEAVNIPNRGYITNLPEGAIVEVPANIGASGVEGISVGALPEAIASICRTQLTIGDLNVRAFVEGDRRLINDLLSIDPMVTDIDVAQELADAYIVQNGESLSAATSTLAGIAGQAASSKEK